jgi:hypothetical protein
MTGADATGLRGCVCFLGFGKPADQRLPGKGKRDIMEGNTLHYGSLCPTKGISP